MSSLLDWIVERVPIRTGLGVTKTIRLLNPIAFARNLWAHRELIYQLTRKGFADVL